VNSLEGSLADMDDAFGFGDTDGARWIRREKECTARRRRASNRRVIAIKEQPGPALRPLDTSFLVVPHFQVSGARCRAVHTRAPRIQNRIAEGIAQEGEGTRVATWDRLAQPKRVQRSSHAVPSPSSRCLSDAVLNTRCPRMHGPAPRS